MGELDRHNFLLSSPRRVYYRLFDFLEVPRKTGAWWSPWSGGCGGWWVGIGGLGIGGVGVVERHNFVWVSSRGVY